jgi:hypothetical protein
MDLTSSSSNVSTPAAGINGVPKTALCIVCRSVGYALCNKCTDPEQRRERSISATSASSINIERQTADAAESESHGESTAPAAEHATSYASSTCQASSSSVEKRKRKGRDVSPTGFENLTGLSRSVAPRVEGSVFDGLMSAVEKRKSTSRENANVHEKPILRDWQRIDIQEKKFVYKNLRVPSEKVFVSYTADTLKSKPSLGKIFCGFFDLNVAQQLLQENMDRVPAGRSVKVSDIYKTTAMEIRLMAQQCKSVRLEQEEKKDAQLNAFKDAANYFEEKFPGSHAPGVRRTKIIHGMEFSGKLMTSINKNLTHLLKHLGEYVSGDEKVFSFTGRSYKVKAISSKGQKGLWFYELCAVLRNGKSVLLWAKLMGNVTAYGESIPVDTVVRSWVKVIEEYGTEYTKLSFDSYYFAAASRAVLVNRDIPTIASVAKERFKEVHDFVAKYHNTQKKNIDSGRSFGHNEKTGESYLYYYNIPMKRMKSIWTNICTVEPGRTPSVEQPLYDLYILMFKACDLFNNGLEGMSFPFRHGAPEGSTGAKGAEKDFILTSLVKTTIAYFLDIHNIQAMDPEGKTKELMLQLADEVFQFGIDQQKA